jgi:hypothetical protein
MREIKDYPIRFSKEANDIINSKITTFVQAMLQKKQSASYYAEKRNTNIEKAAKDIFLGKKSEFVALAALVKYFQFPHVDIDLEIRKGAAKKWAVDLAFQGFPNAHVKSCNRDSFRYCDDFTWTFQKSNNDGRGGEDDVLKVENNDIIVLVYMEEATDSKGIVKAIIPQSEITPLLKLPRNPKYWGIKRCIYYKDLMEQLGMGCNKD